MDLLRFLLPSLSVLVAGIVLVLLIAKLSINGLQKNGETGMVDAVKMVRRIILILIAVFYGLYVYFILIANEIPRQDIDRTTQQQGINNFEQRVREAADAPKKVDTTNLSSNKNK